MSRQLNWSKGNISGQIIQNWRIQSINRYIKEKAGIKISNWKNKDLFLVIKGENSEEIRFSGIIWESVLKK